MDETPDAPIADERQMRCGGMGGSRRVHQVRSANPRRVGRLRAMTGLSSRRLNRAAQARSQFATPIRPPRLRLERLVARCGSFCCVLIAGITPRPRDAHEGPSRFGTTTRDERGACEACSVAAILAVSPHVHARSMGRWNILELGVRLVLVLASPAAGVTGDGRGSTVGRWSPGR